MTEVGGGRAGITEVAPILYFVTPAQGEVLRFVTPAQAGVHDD